MDAEEIKCPICSSNATERKAADQPQMSLVQCARCTKFRITFDATDVLEARPLSATQIASASGWIRESDNSLIDEPDVEKLRNLRAPPELEKESKLFNSRDGMPSGPLGDGDCYHDHRFSGSVHVVSGDTGERGVGFR